MASMESTLEVTKRLDEEFDQYLAAMKPYVLKLPHKSERQRCALWIKKLCEPPGSGVTGRKNRNLYAELLQHMLKRGLLEGPYAHRPDPGPLATLPSYMAIYFDEPKKKSSGARNSDEEGISPPDWVQGELGETRTHTTGGMAGDHASLTPPARKPLFSRSADDKPPHGKEEIRSRFKPSFTYSSDEEDHSDTFKRSRSPPPKTEETRFFHDWNPVTTSTRPGATRGVSSFRDEPSLVSKYEKELEMKTKMLEAKFHEEKLNLQQKHDEAIQKILDRKNLEIEDVKSHYRGKTKENEETIKKLEKKVQTLVKESSIIRENKDKQIAELKKMAEQTTQSSQNEYEKKLHDAIADFEQEKFDMQKQHTKNIQELLDDTNARLQKMEGEYNAQVAANSNVIKELEDRVQQLTQEAETHSSTRIKLGQERLELESRHNRLVSDHEELKAKYSALDKEYNRLREDHDREVRQVRNKTDATLEYMRQEHSLSTAKSSDSIRDLEQQVMQLKQSLQESEHQRQRQVRELEAVQKQDRMHMEHLHDKKVQSLKTELEQEKHDSRRKIKKLEDAVREKDELIERMTDQHKVQAQQSEMALEDFKKQVEKNSGKMFDEMKQQMERVESDLTKSKTLREKQAKEFLKQMEEQSHKYEQEIAEMKLKFEQEKASLLKDYHTERETVQREHDAEIEKLSDKMRTSSEDQEIRSRERQRRDDQTISELEQQIRELREEVIQSNSLRKQQIVELGLLREEEKQKASREHESTISKMKSEMEQQKLKLQREHSGQMEKALEQTNNRLKEIEKEYTQRLTKSAETISELQSILQGLREEGNCARMENDRKISSAVRAIEDEKESLKRQHSNFVKSLQIDLDTQKSKVRQLEKKLQHQEFDRQEKINHLRQDYENKMKGLMPNDIREELEDTISSLKSQVNSLQQRAMILQEELDAKNKYSVGFGSPTRLN
ncbi:centrosomal protein of 112 kDa-like isoform X2 [Ptychodera flava]|uniref:centrosomal protein of 112 kDa-like isoform X2 n=1 Tax=Ptychodera flava TaxID=63121 RepID=UPI00396A9FF7